MTTYRAFRNYDPPAVAEVWNEALTGRGAVHLAGSLMLEQQVFAKPYFDPEGLILATEDGKVVGFGHAGFGPNAQETDLSHQTGVLCLLAVHPAFRRRRIGSELLSRCESYLQQGGATECRAGLLAPFDPFYFGLYGGSDLPGILTSEETAEPFLTRHGYSVVESTAVFQRDLQRPSQIVDRRFLHYRKRYEIFADEAKARPTWWRNCVLGTTEPLEFTLVDKDSNEVLAESLVTELEGFGHRWNRPAVGIRNVQVAPDHRRKGMGKYFLSQILNFLQQQCFEIAEIQVNQRNDVALHMLTQMGFTQVDTGRVYQKRW